jgi:hypothetical protein
MCLADNLQDAMDCGGLRPDTALNKSSLELACNQLQIVSEKQTRFNVHCAISCRITADNNCGNESKIHPFFSPQSFSQKYEFKQFLGHSPTIFMCLVSGKQLMNKRTKTYPAQSGYK